MKNSKKSKPERRVVYRGKVVITGFDPCDLSGLDAELDDVTDLDEGEELFVSLHGKEGLEVAKLRKEIQ